MTLRLVPKLDPHYHRSMAEVRERVSAWRVGRARVTPLNGHRNPGQWSARLHAGAETVGHASSGLSLARPSRHDWRDHAGPWIWSAVVFLGALAWCLAPAVLGGMFLAVAGSAVLVWTLRLMERA